MAQSIALNDDKAPSGWLRMHVLPLFLIFLIPGFSWWFFDRAESVFDDQIQKELVSEIQASPKMSAEERQKALAYFSTIKMSEVMASHDPKWKKLQTLFEPASFRYATFRWAKRTSQLCIGSTLFALVFVGAGVLWSFRSQASQYQALRVGWPVLRGIAVLQVVGQSVLAVALSFWVTALWFEMYILKLIAIMAILALGAVGIILKAMFAKTDSRFEQMGELLPEEEAPALWDRVREIASRLGTTPPDNIVVGIDASFYVTEHDIWLGDNKLSGRTLFVSLPLLKVLSVAEADAVLGHEMAHFSGEDTMWSRKIGPLLQRMGLYLAHLSQGGLALPVFYFLQFFWTLYQLSLGKMSRAREFRADQIGAETSSPAALASSLVKIGAYCTYRVKTEEDIMLREKTEELPCMALRLERGFPAFLSGFTANPFEALTETGHPFDSHPPLNRRVQALGLTMTSVYENPSLHEPISRSWRDNIKNASVIEQGMWTKQEQLMVDVRESNHVMTLIPQTEEEKLLVAKHFPEKTFRNEKGETAVLDHASISLSGWSAPVNFDRIDEMELKEGMGKNTLHLTYRQDDESQPVVLKFQPEAFTCADGTLLDALGFYYGRHRYAKAHAD